MKIQKSFDVPILFIVFDRPNTTKKVFSVIKKIRPSKLFIAADGPRKNKIGEKDKCEKVRKIIENIDWPCEVKRLYRKKNLGCKYAVSGAIDWFFENVDEGIILEDDCLPDITFFKFCSEMLKKYRNTSQIMHIGGTNLISDEDLMNDSYYFSRSPLVWGWATWKRAWKYYDVNLNDLSKTEKVILDNYSLSLMDKLYWHFIFKEAHDNMINTWDYQWVYSIWKNKGVTIIPNVNLVKNIGFLKTATHTKNAIPIAKNSKTHKIHFPLRYSKDIIINRKKDVELSKKGFNINLISIAYLILSGLVNNI